MKKLLSFIMVLCLTVAIVNTSQTVMAEQTPFQVKSGQMELVDSGAKFTSQNGVEANFSKTVKLKDFVTAFTFDEEALNGQILQATLSCEGVTVNFEFVLEAQTFSAKYSINNAEVDCGNLAYRKGEIQIRISKERALDFTTGNFIYNWAIRINASENRKSRLTEAQANLFDACADTECEYSFKTGISSFIVHRIGNYHFNNYIQLDGLQAVETGFETVSLVWQEVGNGVNSLILERSGGSEDNFLKLMPSVTTYNDIGLTQNTEYIYTVKGYDTDEDSVNLAPVLLVLVKSIKVNTLAGNPTPYIIGLIVGVVIVMGIILLYAIYPKLKKGGKRNEK